MESYKKKVLGSETFYNESFLSFDFELTKFNYLAIKEYFMPGDAIEMGPALGQMTKLLVDDFKEIHLIEASKSLIDQIPDYPNTKKYNCYFEEFESDISVDTIVMSHVLEHLEKPVEILSKFRKFLKDNGVFLISVPNAKSIHRLVAVEMGLLSSIYSLNERDIALGHYRVYDIDSLTEDCTNAGFEVVSKGGVFLKPLSNGQIEKEWTSEMVSAFNSVGRKLPEYCAEIFVVLRKSL
jgi:2-polyprenyl-3-methyl-5-hydroxy-6-metoxy-1,4-benzoquinol methylase